MPSAMVDIYPFVFDASTGLSLDEVSHIWNSALPDVLATITGSENPEMAFEQAVKIDVPIVLVYHPIRVDGLCKLIFRHIQKGNRSIFLARLQVFGKDNEDYPYMEVDHKAEHPLIAIRGLSYAFASWLFVVEGEIESL